VPSGRAAVGLLRAISFEAARRVRVAHPIGVMRRAAP